MSATRRQFLQVLGMGSAAAALQGCDQAQDSLAALLDPQGDADFAAPQASTIDDISHVLNRLTYGPRPGDYARVKSIGAASFIDQQLNPESISDRRCQWKIAELESLGEQTGELYEFHPRQILLDLTRGRLLRGTSSQRQLFELMVEFWTDHFNIVSSKDHCRWLKLADDRDVIRVHAMGSFRELVRASAISPAMLIYLDGHDNKVERPGDRPNENYARELLELHTLGVHGGYTQRDVMEVARCLSGWTYAHAPLRFKPATVEFVPARHDNGRKTVLGIDIPAGGGANDLERVLDIVCKHPSTAHHIATRFCRWFIADPAPQSAVDQVASAFLASRGDIRASLHALFRSDAFGENRGNLFKRPMRFVISALRAVDARSNAGPAVIEFLERMGHAPFQYPTPDGYPIEAQPWLGTLLWRWNFALDLTRNRLAGTRVDAASLIERHGGESAVIATLLGRQPTDAERAVLESIDSPIALALASPAFQRC
jgi:uncharacterized protein (DUF1800 family)